MFIDRQVQYPNKRKLTILDQSDNVIIADIVREEGVIIEEGTLLNSTNLNKNIYGTTIWESSIGDDCPVITLVAGREYELYVSTYYDSYTPQCYNKYTRIFKIKYVEWDGFPFLIFRVWDTYNFVDITASICYYTNSLICANCKIYKVVEYEV